MTFKILFLFALVGISCAIPLANVESSALQSVDEIDQQNAVEMKSVQQDESEQQVEMKSVQQDESEQQVEMKSVQQDESEQQTAIESVQQDESDFFPIYIYSFINVCNAGLMP